MILVSANGRTLPRAPVKGDAIAAETIRRIIEELGKPASPGGLGRMTSGGAWLQDQSGLAGVNWKRARVLSVLVGGVAWNGVDPPYPWERRYTLLCRDTLFVWEQVEPYWGCPVKFDEARIYPRPVDSTVFYALVPDVEGVPRARAWIDEVTAREDCSAAGGAPGDGGEPAARAEPGGTNMDYAPPSIADPHRPLEAAQVITLSELGACVELLLSGRNRARLQIEALGAAVGDAVATLQVRLTPDSEWAAVPGGAVTVASATPLSAEVDVGGCCAVRGVITTVHGTAGQLGRLLLTASREE